MFTSKPTCGRMGKTTATENRRVVDKNNSGSITSKVKLQYLMAFTNRAESH